jgi:hypothetical protein
MTIGKGQHYMLCYGAPMFQMTVHYTLVMYIRLSFRGKLVSNNDQLIISGGYI